MTEEKVFQRIATKEISTRTGRARTGAIRAALMLVFSMMVVDKASALPCPPEDWVQEFHWCVGSPIIIDTDGNGFHLTSAENGVRFDINGTGQPIQMAWTASGSTNAFLALPHDGVINSGKDLFGNFTLQPSSDHPNGFLALAVYDLPQNGGNGDGVIDWRDAIFSSLVLWIDSNHDGIAQPEELHSLPELGVFSISLHYTESRSKDQFGNLFRYKSRINLVDGEQELSPAGPVAYDVFFTIVNGAVH